MPNESAQALQVIDPQVPAPMEPAAPPAPVSETATILQMIGDMATNPAADVGKMRELLDVYRQVKADAAKLDYDRAMSDAQKDMRAIVADADNNQTRSRYATYFALDAAIKPIYTRHGFSISFDTAPAAAANMVRVVAKVAHRSGHREYPQLDMPADGKGAKGGDVMTLTHATGSAITYGRRYLLQMIFNLAVGGDDDGNGAGGVEYITAEQKAELVEMLKAAGAVDPNGPGTAKFLKLMKVESLDQIPAKDFNKARNALAQKRASTPS